MTVSRILGVSAERSNNRSLFALVIRSKHQPVKVAVKCIRSCSVTKIIVCNILLCKRKCAALHVGISRLDRSRALVNDLLEEGAVNAAVNLGKSEI